MSEALVTQQETSGDVDAAAEYRARADRVRTEAQKLLALINEKEAEIAALGSTDADGMIEALEIAHRQLDEIRDQQYVVVAEALGPRYTPADVASWCNRALDMGASHPRFDAGLIEDLMYMRRVPNAPFRDRLCALETVEGQERRAYGTEEHWVSGRYSGDTRYVKDTTRKQVKATMGWDDRDMKRSLGMNTRSNGNGGKVVTLFLRYEAASLLAPILNFKPHAAGI